MKASNQMLKSLNRILAVVVIYTMSLMFTSALASAQSPPSSLFTYVSSLSKLKTKIAEAATEHKPVMIEFFATWCPYCQRLDRDVLSSSEVRQAMKHFVTLRVDASDETPENSRMLDAFNVVGFPTLIFYDKKGNLFDASSLNDGISSENLLSVLNQLS